MPNQSAMRRGRSESAKMTIECCRHRAVRILGGWAHKSHFISVRGCDGGDRERVTRGCISITDYASQNYSYISILVRCSRSGTSTRHSDF
ncbi:hypothetical protein Tco_0123108 [Tanacetum coccineum]